MMLRWEGASTVGFFPQQCEMFASSWDVLVEETGLLVSIFSWQMVIKFSTFAHKHGEIGEL